jgi:hypothetical protein
MPSADTRNIGRARSPLARIVFSSDGEIRTMALVGIVTLSLAVLGAGTFAGLVAAGTGSPQVLGVWVAVAFVGIKLPLLGLIWYLLGRSGETTVRPRWSPAEADGILDYLERESTAALRRRDATTRLEYFTTEAWYVANTAPESARGRAVDLAVRIEGLAEVARAREARAGVLGERTPPPRG